MDLKFLNILRRRKKTEEEFFRKKSKSSATLFKELPPLQPKPLKKFKTYNEILEGGNLKYKIYDYLSPKRKKDLEPFNNQNTPYNNILMNGTQPSQLNPITTNQLSATLNPNSQKPNNPNISNGKKPLTNPGLKKGLYKQEGNLNAQEVLKRNQLMLQQRKKELAEQEAAFNKKMKEENERLEKMRYQKHKLEQEQNAQKSPTAGVAKKILMAAGVIAVPAATAVSSRELLTRAYLQPTLNPDKYNFNSGPSYSFQTEDVKNIYTFEE